jgi:hypothetical protein
MAGVALGLVALLATATAVLGASPDPSQDPGISTAPGANLGPDAPNVTARGPFGSVAGISAAGMPDPNTLPILDAWGRGTGVGFESSKGYVASWDVAAFAEPALDAGSPLALGHGKGSAYVQMAATGLFLVRLDATVAPFKGRPEDGLPVKGSWWWRIAVPDRELRTGDGGVPPPRIRLRSGDRVRSLDPGSGCWIGTCGDIGAIPPPRTLPTIRTLPGAPLTVTLSDNSGIIEWYVDATPLGGQASDAIDLGHAEGVPSTTRVTVPAPARGSWVISVFVRFDQQRGDFTGYGRLILREP